MRIYYSIFSIFIHHVCFGQTVFPDSTIYIRGNGLNNSTLFLFPNGTGIYESWCDICPTERSFGTYNLKGDTVFFSFEKNVVYGSREYLPEDSVVTEDNWLDTLYRFAWNDEDFLIYSGARIRDEIALYEKHPDPRLFNVIMQKYLRIRKKKQIPE